jgi:hypothetical protein
MRLPKRSTLASSMHQGVSGSPPAVNESIDSSSSVRGVGAPLLAAAAARAAMPAASCCCTLPAAQVGRSQVVVRLLWST